MVAHIPLAPARRAAADDVADAVMREFMSAGFPVADGGRRTARGRDAAGRSVEGEAGRLNGGVNAEP
jgi:hypothetical protein